ncbi:MAG: hypothetical protein ACRDSP_19440 [Pseudonocardiaceae bacterium]
MTDAASRFPNVCARLRRTHTAPGIQPSETTLTIWLWNTAFRVRDEAGRPYSDVVNDVRSARGFGATPRTMEEFMDTSYRSRHSTDRDPTELYGDFQTGEATVREAGQDPWPVSPEVIAPVAAQLLTDGREAELELVSTTTYLDRPCAEYRFTLTGDEDGVPYRSDVRRLVSGPFVLLQEVRDERISQLATVTEVVELNEGTVTDADLRP